jgi:TolB protein
MKNKTPVRCTRDFVTAPLRSRLGIVVGLPSRDRQGAVTNAEPNERSFLLVRVMAICLPVVVALSAAVLFAQDIQTWITGAGGKPALAVVDFRGAGDAQPLMGPFNSTLFGDLQSSALFDMKPKSMFPLNNPQQPNDLRPEDAGEGYALRDWAGSPTNASHLVFGYTAVTNGVLVLYGYVYDTRQQNPQSAQLMFDRLTDSPNEAGAISLAHKFANDIIVKFGGASLLGTRIYFVSDRGAAGKFGTELWVMDWDGNNQRQLTHLGGQVAYPAVSPDGSRLAVTFWPGAGGQPRIYMINSETGRTINFYNQQASLNAAATFTPDGARVFYSSSASGTAQIYTAAIDGQGFSRVTSTRGNPSEPKVNPKNPDSLLFVDGAPNEQIYRMNAEGTGIERVTNGEGEASNPSWNPDGQHVAYAWTRGYQTGDFNIFVIDIGAPQKYIQLTHSEGKNENPVWAPDAFHIVFASTRSKRSQLYTMLADGSQVKQLTTQGTNKYPVWGVK